MSGRILVGGDSENNFLGALQVNPMHGHYLDFDVFLAHQLSILKENPRINLRY